MNERNFQSVFLTGTVLVIVVIIMAYVFSNAKSMNANVQNLDASIEETTR